MNEKASIQETESGEPGLKRYMITDRGTFLLHEMVKNREEARRREARLMPLLIGSFEPEDHPPRIIELNRSVGNLLILYWDLLDSLRERYSERTVEEAIKAVDVAARSIEELITRP